MIASPRKVRRLSEENQTVKIKKIFKSSLQVLNLYISYFSDTVNRNACYNKNICIHKDKDI